MPLRPIRLSEITPGKSVCQTCDRRQLGCHKGCEDFAIERIALIATRRDTYLKKRLDEDMYLVNRQRYKRGLHE